MKSDQYYTLKSANEIVRILKDEIDTIPSVFKCIISLNVARYVGSSKVCGVVNGYSFELRNRKDPYLSIQAHGTIKPVDSGAMIRVEWVKPKFPDIVGAFFFKRYPKDIDTIISFLVEWIEIVDNEIG
jgi:hypothetical protein